MKSKINLGPSGNCAKDTKSSLRRLKEELKLQSQELAFTFGVSMKISTAKEIGNLRKELGIELSIHAPYYINLANENKVKLKKSYQWILDSCERGHYLGAKNIVFHPGFYQKRKPDYVFDLILENLKYLKKEIKKRRWDVELAPEVTGKLSAFGDLDEIIELAVKAKCGFCIDFAHLYARNQGHIDFSEVLDKLRRFKHIHSHFSSIEFTKKGERRHLVLKEKKPDFEKLADELLKRKIDITIISETPITWQDSLEMKRILERKGYQF